MAIHSAALQIAHVHAQSGRFLEMLAACRLMLDEHNANVDALLDIGTMLFSFGFISYSRECFERACILAPNDLRSAVNLANLANGAGDHDKARHLYAALLERLPNHAVIRRNALVSMEYDPMIPDGQRFAQARAWGGMGGCSVRWLAIPSAVPFPGWHAATHRLCFRRFLPTYRRTFCKGCDQGARSGAGDGLELELELSHFDGHFFH